MKRTMGGVSKILGGGVKDPHTTPSTPMCAADPPPPKGTQIFDDAMPMPEEVSRIPQNDTFDF